MNRRRALFGEASGSKPPAVAAMRRRAESTASSVSVKSAASNRAEKIVGLAEQDVVSIAGRTILKSSINMGVEVMRTPKGSLRPMHSKILVGNTPGGSTKKIATTMTKRRVEEWLNQSTTPGPNSVLSDDPALLLEGSDDVLPVNNTIVNQPQAGPSHLASSNPMDFFNIGLPNEVDSDGENVHEALQEPNDLIPPHEDVGVVNSDNDESLVVAQPVPAIQREIPLDADMDPEDATMINNLLQEIDEEHDHLSGLDTNFNWVEDFSQFTGKPEIFTAGKTGPTQNFESCYDTFSAIWDNDIISIIVDNTNKHAKREIERRTLANQFPQHARLRKWVDVTAGEIYILLAIFMYMGIYPLTKLEDYWKPSSKYVGFYGFREIMKFSRYQLITRYLHFVDDSLMSDSDRKLFKLRPIIDKLNEKFQQLYVLDRVISLDESLSLWKGFLSWVQMIRTKAARFGIKTFELCEASTGYLWRFEVYTGKMEGGSEESLSEALSGKTSKIVLRLLKGLENKGYCVVMDNFYNCPSLARYLKSQGFDCFGTVRPNRKHIPNVIKTMKSNVPQGSIVARHSGDVSVLGWKDSKVVNMISTYHTNETRLAQKAGKPHSKPVSVIDYNKGMGGVDRKDQKLSMYLIERKRTRKWNIKMFKRLLNGSVLNSHVLFSKSQQECGKTPIEHRAFRIDLADDLVRRYCPNLSTRQPREITEARLNRDLQHIPLKLKKKVRCARCAALGKEKRTSMKCSACDRGLCESEAVVGCWLEYHSLENLKTA